MTTNDDQYVPDEEQVRAWCREGVGDYPDVMDEWLDRFLARVRRDAKAEGWQAGVNFALPNAETTWYPQHNPYRVTETGDRA